jgi:hypothetical protein
MSALPKIVVTVIAVFALVGCGNNGPRQDVNAAHSSGLATPPPSSTTTPPSTAAQPKKSPRGNMIKKLGEAAGLCTDDSCTNVAVTFTLDKIELDPKCTGKSAKVLDAKPEHGHFVALSFTVKTTEKFTGDSASFSINPYDFSVVGPDGITETTSYGSGTYGCLPDSEMLSTSNYAPSSQYVGKVLIDTKHSRGTIMLRSAIMGDGGWEWEF